ncbi:nitrilase-related carbon-nitrogen hydrolase [Algihabitans albus]|uniref:nitrilase-related carbon-nitrogen hydrolase n=1 Tax=Algihabitans albus TaxID=2164067 RepID=UPI0035CF0E77
MTDTVPETLTIALWAVNLAKPLNGIGAWAAAVEAQMLRAKSEGADLLMLPEYMSEQWLSFAPEGIGADEEVPWMAAQAEAALAAIAPLPAKHGMALLAGTLPVLLEPVPEAGSPYVNRAHLLLPDGRVVRQDKLCLTPGEKDPAAWNLRPGERLQIVTWKGLKLATLICLDIELPALAASLAPERPDLILVPSMTAKLSGYARVFGCARARAVELQAAVAAVGVIGAASTNKPRETNTSGCSVFLPCEESLGFVGLHDEIPPTDAADDDGELLIARDIPFGEIRRLRAGAAEVWPGAWTADHVTLEVD